MDKDVMKAIEDLIGSRPALLVETLMNASMETNNEAALLAEALHAIAGSFRAEADMWPNSKRKGWQSTATKLREAAGLVTDVAKALEKFDLPKRPEQSNPHRAPLETINGGEGFVYREPLETIDKAGPEPAVMPENDDLTAYLRGDTDVLPPMRAADEPAPPATATPDIHKEAASMTQTFPIPPGAMAGIVNGPTGPVSDPADPFTDPKPPAWNGGSNGRYVPTGGRSLSFADLMKPPAPHLVPQHWSWSQLESSEDCAVQYRLQRIEQLPQVPQWANIGGDAFHKATEDLDMRAHSAGVYSEPDVASEVWRACFNQAIADVASSTPVPIDKWRASASGKENQDWWRVEGERMLMLWCENRAKLDRQVLGSSVRKLALLPHSHPEVGAGRAPAIEWGFDIAVHGPMGQLTYTGIVDRVWECSDGSLLIEDLKSGSRMPQDTAQLGSYAWAVLMAGGVSTHTPDGGNVPRIMGTFYNARKGVWTPAVDLLAAHPWDELVYRLHAAEAKRRAGLYTPHVSNFCVSCSVQYACPLRNREGQPS